MRSPILLVALLCAALPLLAGAALSLAPGPAPASNGTPIVLITIDTLRADRTSPYGYAGAKTPQMEGLARDGVLFENAYVQTPITLPSHASILTGTYPMYHKLQDVVGRLREGVPTLATILQEAGYATGAFVGATVLSSRWMLNRGFDVYDDYFEIPEGLRQVDFDRVERTADEVMAPALKWLGENERRPFFLWVHLYDPHDPYTPPAPFSEEFRDRPYDGEIAYTDAVTGKLFDYMKRKGLYDKSLIVYTADHGESLGEHKEVYHGYFIYDASLRVPLIFKLPSGQFKGSRFPNTVRSVDIAPTVLQLLELRTPPSNQGESLLAVMAGKRQNVNYPVYSESHYPKIHFNWSALFGYQLGRHKYIDAPRPELYDTESDPQELKNIVDNNRALASRLKSELKSMQKRYSAPDSESQVHQEVDSETVARLRSLGYIALSSGSRGDSRETDLPDPKDKIQVYNQLNRGIALSRRGFRDRAIETFTEVARLEPDMPIARFLLGMEYFEKGWFLKAIEEFQETLVRNPNSNVAMFNQARAYFESGQTEKAEEGFKFILEKEPANFGARHYLSMCYARRARYQEAADEELKALRYRPDFAEGHNNLGSFYLNLDQVDKAIESYRKAVSLRPAFLMARVNLALAYIRKGAYDDAITQARAVIDQDSRRSMAHYYLGQAYLAKGMKQEARQAFQKARELDPRLNVPSIP